MSERFAPNGYVLGVDLGTTAGWCIMAPDGTIIECGVWGHAPATETKKRVGEPDGARYTKFRDNLIALLDRQAAAGRTVTHIAFEIVHRHPGGVKAAHAYGGYKAILTSVAFERCIPCDEVEVSAVKIAATGKGRAEKEDVVDAAAKRWPQLADRLCPTADTINDDLGDALWITEIRRLELTGDRATWQPKRPRKPPSPRSRPSRRP
jgi:Holliday junction resolvasome RuvABC endonuclease subunit